MDFLPVALLVGALVLFLASTRQTAIHWRLIAWIVAAGLIVAATIQNVVGTNSAGLLSSLLRHPNIVAAAFRGNWPAMQEFVAPALDILLLLGALVGVGCLIALTPGERVERVVRPINIGLIGAIVGGAIVLAVSAIGFGPVSKRQVFIGHVTENDLVDGDTLRMGDVALRIWGIDAPEDNQICLDANRLPFDCGASAKDALRKLAFPGPVFCHSPEGLTAADSDNSQLRESFGRPLVKCGGEQGQGSLPDIGRALVLMGYAYPYESADGVLDSDYAPELKEAIRNRSGLHNGVFLKPTLWRNDPHARCHLLAAVDLTTKADEASPLEQQMKRLKKACGLPG